MQHNLSSWGGEQASRPQPKPFTLVQHNCLGSWDVFLSLFGSFTQLAHIPCIVALQDPPVITLAGIACIIMREVYATIVESIYPNPSFLSRDFPEASGRLLRNLKEFTFQDMAN